MRLLRTSAATLLALTLGTWPGGTQPPRGERSADPPPNPHWRSDQCSLCHGEGEPASIPAAEWESICAQCHDLESIGAQVHPFGFEPGALRGRMESHGVPLADGVLTCASCHDLRPHCRLDRDAQSSNPAALRGPGGGDVVSLCFQCHDEEPFIRRDPHVQVRADGSPMEDKCLMCHGESPGETTGHSLRAPAAVICAACHVLENHPQGFDHALIAESETVLAMVRTEIGETLSGMTPSQMNRYMALRSIEPRRLPLGENREITCFTCHDPHDPRLPGFEGGERHTHRLRMDSAAICLACHEM
jgi:Doubled CXXCH motif (Paired_CXXCH_1)